jgi:hypothetical protein
MEHELRHSGTDVVVNLPGNSGAFLLQEPSFFFVERQLRHEPETYQNDRTTDGEQSDLKPAGLPKEHLDWFQRWHLVHI